MKQILFLLAIVIASSCTKDMDVEPARVESKRILVDASGDGGVWWFPQGGGRFNPEEDHQGKKLADLLRSKGFVVDELPRKTVLNAATFSKYDKVIRAAKYGSYTQAELDAYKSFLSRPSALLLAGEFLRPGQRDDLADMLGLKLAGMARGNIQTFAPHEITSNVSPFYYWAGSVVMNLENKNFVPLGWLDTKDFADLNGNERFDTGEPKGPPVMGLLKHPTARIFFIGDLNGIEQIPQPFTDNLVAWLFK